MRPGEATLVADAIVRVFIDQGDRTNRLKARLKYVLDAWGLEKFLAAVEEKLGRKLARAPAAAMAPRPAFDRTAHVGVHAQKQPGLNWIGVALPVGKITAEQMRGLAGEAVTKFGVRDVAVVHRLGRLQVGETSVLIVVASAHRGAAFDACRWLIDTLKKTVPIWKKEQFVDGATWADGEPFPGEIGVASSEMPG